MCKSHTKKIGALKLSQQDVGKNCIFRGCEETRKERKEKGVERKTKKKKGGWKDKKVKKKEGREKERVVKERQRKKT